VTSVHSLAMAVEDADALLLLVNHTEFHQVNPEVLAALTPARILIDTVNGWGGLNMAEQGFKLFRLGDGRR